MIERVFRTMTDSEREEPTLPSALEPPLQLFYRTAVALDSATGLPLLSERLAAATGCSMSGSALGLWGGAKLFGKSSERVFRISAYVLILISAVISLPLMDRLLIR